LFTVYLPPHDTGWGKSLNSIATARLRMGAHGYGTVFKVNPDGMGFMLLHEFTMNGTDL